MQERSRGMPEMQVADPVPSQRRRDVELLTARQVQQRLNVDPTTIYRMAADGRLPAVKVGRQWRFPSDGVEALLAGGSEQARSAASLEPSAVQAVLDVAAPMLGVMMLVTDMTGRPVSHVANPCPWFAEHADDEQTLATCTQEWRAMADDLDFSPHFRQGALGFECARAFIRAGSELIGQVLVGGVAPEGDDNPGLHHLDDAGRQSVLDALPRVSAALSRTADRPPAPTPGQERTSAHLRS